MPDVTGKEPTRCAPPAPLTKNACRNIRTEPKPPPATASLKLSSIQPSQIYVDGKLVRDSAGAVEVTPGRHVVSFVAPDGRRVSRVVDLATLTGSMIIACGSDYTGLFTSDGALADELMGAADRASELMWRMPLHQPYKRLLKGTWGRIKNVGGREAGSVTAALYLQHFVEEGTRWAHMDIAGTAFADKPVDPYVAGGTGQVVRTLVSWAEKLIADQS